MELVPDAVLKRFAKRTQFLMGPGFDVRAATDRAEWLEEIVASHGAVDGGLLSFKTLDFLVERQVHEAGGVDAAVIEETSEYLAIKLLQLEEGYSQYALRRAATPFDFVHRVGGIRWRRNSLPDRYGVWQVEIEHDLLIATFPPNDSVPDTDRPANRLDPANGPFNQAGAGLPQSRGPAHPPARTTVAPRRAPSPATSSQPSGGPDHRR